MRTIFALFEGYREAKRAVDALISKNFNEQEITVIVLAHTARAGAGVGGSEKPGGERPRGIDGLLAARQPFTLPDVGDVCAAGKMAAIVAKAAGNRESAARGLKGALVELDVPDEIAGFYASGVSHGGVLISMGTPDARAAEAAGVLSNTKGEEVTGYA